jgi:hypothetical protein
MEGIGDPCNQSFWNMIMCDWPLWWFVAGNCLVTLGNTCYAWRLHRRLQAWARQETARFDADLHG